MKKIIQNTVLGFVCVGCTSTQAITLGECDFVVEKAQTEAQMEQGLSGRTSLEANQGMLFYLPSTFQKGSAMGFHMRRMKFDIDMLFFGEDGALTEVQTVPMCETEQCPYYQPEKPTRYVLEIGSGVAEKCEIEIGEKLTLLQQ